MPAPHRHVVHDVSLRGGGAPQAFGSTVTASCFHHQRLDRLGFGLEVTGQAADGTPEVVELLQASGWFLGLQWHPEDTAAHDPKQQAAFDALAAQARARRAT